MTTCENCPLHKPVADHHECPPRGILDGLDMEACKIGLAMMAKRDDKANLLAERQRANRTEERSHAQAPKGPVVASKRPK